MSEMRKIFLVQNMQHQFGTLTKKSNLAKILGQMVHISQRLVISHTFYVIAAAKVLCSLSIPPTPSVTLSWQKPQYPEG